MKLKAQALAVLLVALVAACDSTVPPSNLPAPTAAPSAAATPTASAAPTPTASASGKPQPPPKAVGDIALEMCDAEGVLPCEHQAAVLTVPIAATGVAFTYSTEWADGRLDRPASWSAAPLGLGGWSLDVLQRYDQENEVLLGGDGSWRIASAVDVGGGEHAVPTFDGFRYFVFDASWRHVRTIDTVTGITLLTFTYDANGLLSDVTGNLDQGPIQLAVHRSPDGTPGSIEGAGATVTRFGFDETLITNIYHPDRTALTLTAGDFGLIDNALSTGSGIVRWEYDDAGRVTSMTDPDGVVARFAFEAADGVASVATTYATGGTSTVRFERDGDLLKRTWADVDGTSTVLDTNSDGSTLLTEPDGTTTSVGAVAHPVWGAAAPLRTPFVETRPDGVEYLVETTTTMGTSAPSPAGGAWRTETTANGNLLVDAYDPATRTFTRTDATGRSATQVFDDRARLVAASAPGAPALAFEYNDDGLLTSSSVGSATTSYSYDTATGTVTVTAPDGTTATHEFDAFGQPKRSAFDGESASYVSDPAGAVIQVRTGAHPATTLGMSDAGRETAYIPPAVENDQSFEVTTYNDAGLVSSIEGPGDRSIAIEYDSAGRATSWAFDQESVTAQYDATTGLLTRHVTSAGVTTEFAYSGWVPAGLAWSGPVTGAVDVTVDGQLRPTSASVNGNDPVAYTYDSAGFLAGIDDATIERDTTSGLAGAIELGAVRLTSDFDADGRLVTRATTSDDSTLLAQAYEYDGAGRVATLTLTAADGQEATVSYSYDATGRLSSVTSDGATESYAYDEAGNRTAISFSDGSPQITADYDDRDRIESFGDITYESNGDGTLATRVTSAGTTAYTFDDFGAVRSVTLEDGRVVEYVVDGGGRRIGRTVDGVLTDGYLYAPDDSIVAWLDGSGAVVAQFAYDDSGRLVLVRRDGRDLLVTTDRLGSPILFVDAASGDVVNSVTYDAWGNVVTTDGSAQTPFGFAGGLADQDTGLIHFKARDYDPVTGRWTSADPARYAAGDLNLYRYAFADPVNRIDPTGLGACDVSSCVSSTMSGPFLRGFGGGRGAGKGGSVGTGKGSGGATGGGKTGGGSGGGSKGGKGSPPSGYRDGGPGKGSSGPGGPGKGIPYYQEPDPDRPSNDSSAPRAERPGPTDPTVSVCVGACAKVGPGGKIGGSPLAPGGPCYGLCLGGGVGLCLGICTTGNDDNFSVCILACFYGEPHILTGDSQHISFQAAGEFVVSRAADATLELQARLEPPGGRTDVTRATAVAANVAGDHVGFYSDPARPLVINGEAIDRADYATTLPNGGVVERHGSEATVTWPDDSLLAVHLYGSFVNFALAPSDTLAPGLVGLVGNHDGDSSNDVTTRDGVVLDPDAADFHDQLHGQFADSWRVSQEESLFDYLDGETIATFTLPDIPSAPASLDTLDPQVRSEAETLCRAAGVSSEPTLSSCILDYGLTGDPAYAGSAATVESAVERAGTTVADTGTPIAVGQTISGQLASGATDRYSFVANAGDIVYLDAGDQCDPALDWSLARPDGSPIAFDAACTDLGRRVLAEAGNWRLEIYSDDAAAGSYAFTVISVPQTTEQPIALGESTSGATTAVGEWHRYRLAATAGQVIYLDADVSCESPMSWRLLQPGGGATTFERVCNDLGRRVLDQGGDWVIEIYAFDQSTGPYAFRVLDVPPVRQTSVAVGASVSDVTTQVGEWHRYTFPATLGDIVYLDGLGDCVDGLYWRVLDAAGSVRWFEQSCNDLGRIAVDVAGDWIIEIYSDNLGFGPYSFTLIQVPPADETPISIGQSVNGTVASVGEWHRYRMPAQAGQKIIIDAQGECIDQLLWRLLRPDGALETLAAVCTDSETRTLPVAGDWVIEVYSDATATGSYSFTVNAAQ